MQLLLNRVLSFELKFPTTERRWGGGGVVIAALDARA